MGFAKRFHRCGRRLGGASPDLMQEIAFWPGAEGEIGYYPRLAVKPFLDDDFLLPNETAVRLYHEHAKTEPIIDYHCHLPPDQIASNHRFGNLTEIWLDGDHYKWRAMRANGVPERLVTGNASDWEKFEAWAEDRALHPAQPALPLDPPRAALPLRGQGQAAQRGDRPRDLRPLQRAARAGRLHGAGAAARSTACWSSARPTTPPTRSSTTPNTPSGSGQPGSRALPDLAPRPVAGGARSRRSGTSGSSKLEAAAGVAVIAATPTCSRRSSSATTSFHALGCRALRPRARDDVRRGLHRAGGRGHLRQGPAPARPRRARGDREVPVGGALRHWRSWTTPGAGPSSFTWGPCATTTAACSGRWAPTPASTPSAICPRPGRWRASSTASTTTNQLPKTILYNLNPARQRGPGHHDRQLQDGSVPGQDAVRQRLVVPRPARRHGEADQRAVEHGPALALRRAC